MIQIDERILEEAADILVTSSVSYNCIHAACMRRKGLHTIITEDFSRLEKNQRLKGHKTPQI